MNQYTRSNTCIPHSSSNDSNLSIETRHDLISNSSLTQLSSTPQRNIHLYIGIGRRWMNGKWDNKRFGHIC